MTKMEVFSMLCHLSKLYPESNMARLHQWDKTEKINEIAEAWHPYLKKIPKKEAIEIITDYRKNNHYIIDLSYIYKQWRENNKA